MRPKYRFFYEPILFVDIAITQAQARKLTTKKMQAKLKKEMEKALTRICKRILK